LLLALLGRGTAERGYFVDLTTAVDLLEKLNPQAAAWWRTNTPHLLRQGQNLLFYEDCCVIDDHAPAG
jgi:hypothetical protein